MIWFGPEIPNFKNNKSKKGKFFISSVFEIIFKNGIKDAKDKTSENALLNIINKSIMS